MFFSDQMQDQTLDLRVWSSLVKRWRALGLWPDAGKGKWLDVTVASHIVADVWWHGVGGLTREDRMLSMSGHVWPGTSGHDFASLDPLWKWPDSRCRCVRSFLSVSGHGVETRGQAGERMRLQCIRCWRTASGRSLTHVRKRVDHWRSTFAVDLLQHMVASQRPDAIVLHPSFCRGAFGRRAKCPVRGTTALSREGVYK
jgi:hypothetical protein